MEQYISKIWVPSCEWTKGRLGLIQVMYKRCVVGGDNTDKWRNNHMFTQRKEGKGKPSAAPLRNSATEKALTDVHSRSWPYHYVVDHDSTLPTLTCKDRKKVKRMPSVSRREQVTQVFVISISSAHNKKARSGAVTIKTQIPNKSYAWNVYDNTMRQKSAALNTKVVLVITLNALADTPDKFLMTVKSGVQGFAFWSPTKSTAVPSSNTFRKKENAELPSSQQFDNRFPSLKQR